MQLFEIWMIVLSLFGFVSPEQAEANRHIDYSAGYPVVYQEMATEELVRTIALKQVADIPAVEYRTGRVLDAAGRDRLRWCESRDRYEIVGRTGTFRGGYQFSQETWDTVARHHFPWLVGIDPAAATPLEQDAMTNALWSWKRGGAHHWTCHPAV